MADVILPSYRLTIMGPALTGPYESFFDHWPAIRVVVHSYVKFPGGVDSFGDYLSTGLAYDLPFAFEQSDAESFATELKALGCTVQVSSSR